MLRDIEMQQAAMLMRQHNEHEQDPQPHSGNSKEVDRDQLTDMITQKRLPALGWFLISLWHQTGDGALRDFKAEFEKFPMDSRCAPEGIGVAHGSDQLPNLSTHWRT